MNPRTHARATAALLAGLALAGAGHAQTAENRCVDKFGKVTITDQVCPQGSTKSEVDSRLMSRHSVDAAVQRYVSAWLKGDAEALTRSSVRTDIGFLELRHRLTDPAHRDAALRTIEYSAPRNVKLVKVEFTPQGGQALAYCSAQVKDLNTDALQPTRGIVRLVRVGVDWKVESDDWGPQAW
ncbi:MAG: DUF4124 domain-containing protein [Betaproteobacteria bacterium]|nr:DUF4124 domain-containing protein [Betaproteobacteria bacterium]